MKKLPRNGTWLYRDASNYKFRFTAPVPEGVEIGEDVEYERLGYTKESFHEEVVGYPYGDDDHNLVTLEDILCLQCGQEATHEDYGYDFCSIECMESFEADAIDSYVPTAEEVLTSPDHRIKVISSAGHFYADRNTGKVLEYCVDSKNYEEIAMFDFKEFRAFWNDTPKSMPSRIDILDLGYWLHDGNYEGPDMDWRKDFAQEIENGNITGVVLSPQAARLLNPKDDEE